VDEQEPQVEDSWKEQSGHKVAKDRKNVKVVESKFGLSKLYFGLSYLKKLNVHILCLNYNLNLI